MLDIRTLRENPERVNQLLQRRNPSLSVDTVLSWDEERRQLLQEEESLRSHRNRLSKEVGERKRQGDPAEDLLEQTRQLADRIKAMEAEKDQLGEKQSQDLLGFPNLPMEMVPDGADSDSNVLVRSWGEAFKSRPHADVLPHWDMGVHLGILDFERGVKLAKSRFSIYRGAGSQLARALTQFMLDLHTQHGYEEILPPFLVNRQAMTGTGQLPKFESDMFHCTEDDLFLIPTAEVPLTNMFAGEILTEDELPIHLTAYTPCFRREAGSAGQDTRGLIRQHQFDKVELVKLVHPDESQEAHQQLVLDAERVLQALELPYQVMELCAGDLGFSAARCFDLEVWMPAQKVYREISSCSHFMDFQARRIGLKFRSSETGKPAYLHTLNGSGLAVGRTVAAILENYQVSSTEVQIPKALQPYFHTGQTTLTMDQSKHHECRV